MLPKCSSARDIHCLDRYLSVLERRNCFSKKLKGFFRKTGNECEFSNARAFADRVMERSGATR
jgi:hypothetical protein